jgi:hypothetical protein
MPSSSKQKARRASWTSRIRRHGAASFGPADKFCCAWTFVDLLPQDQGTAS